MQGDVIDFRLLDSEFQENYEKDANACDNIKDYDDNDHNNDNDSEFIKSYKSFLATFDEAFERDYYDEPITSKESILMKIQKSNKVVKPIVIKKRRISRGDSLAALNPLPSPLKEKYTGQKRKTDESTAVKISSTKRAKKVDPNSCLRKWIATDDLSKANFTVIDVLRCLISEFRNNGTLSHDIYEVDESVANLIKDSPVNLQEEQVPELDEPESMIKYCQLPLQLQSTLRDMFDDDQDALTNHKASRIATSLGSECFSKVRDTYASAHLALVTARRDTSKLLKLYWETNSTSLRVSLHNLKKVSLTDIPESSHRLLNPFLSSGSKFEDRENFKQWKWLNSEESGVSEYSDINPKSLFYGKVKPNSFELITTEQMISSTQSADDQEQPEYIKFPFQKVYDIISKDYALIIIDKDTKTTDGDSNPTHRAYLIYDILRKQMFGEVEKSEGKRTVYEDRWGPVLIVVKEDYLDIWKDAYRKPNKKVSSRDPQLITFSGSEAHRNHLKEYLKKDNGLYSPRSHCHIVILSYSTLISEMMFFKTIVWDVLILDEPFGLLSNYCYDQLVEQLKQVKCSTRILSCSSLRQQNDPLVVPDVMEIMNFLYPEIVNILLCDEVLGKNDCLYLESRSFRYMTRLLASFTVVFDEISTEVSSKLNVSPTHTLEYLALFEWLGISISRSSATSNSLSSDINMEKLLLSMEFKDDAIDNELQKKSIVQKKPVQKGHRGRPKGSVMKKDKTIEPKETKPKVSKVAAIVPENLPVASDNITLTYEMTNSADIMENKIEENISEKAYDDMNIETTSENVKIEPTHNDALVGSTFTNPDDNYTIEMDLNTKMEIVTPKKKMIMMKRKEESKEESKEEQIQDVNSSVKKEESKNKSKTKEISDDTSDPPQDWVIDGGYKDEHQKLLYDMQRRVQSILATSLIPEVNESPSKQPKEKKEKSTKEKNIKSDKVSKGKEEKEEKKRKEREQKKKIEDMTKEEERGKSILFKPNLKTWTVSIEFFNRARQLGVYYREVDAIVAFDTAYQQRSEILQQLEMIDTKKNKEQKIVEPLFLRRGCHYSSEIEENLKLLDVENLKNEIRLMMLPKALGDKNFPWTPLEQEQFSYAFLVDKAFKVVRISCHFTTLGNVGNNVLGNLEEIGIPKAQSFFWGIHGLHYSINPNDGEIIHVSHDNSIASKHAKLVWNPDKICFEIKSISNAGLFVDKIKILPSNGFSPLKSGDVVQIGNAIFLFLIPTSSIGNVSPIRRRIMVIEDLIKYAKTRSDLITMSNNDDENSKDEEN